MQSQTAISASSGQFHLAFLQSSPDNTHNIHIRYSPAVPPSLVLQPIRPLESRYSLSDQSVFLTSTAPTRLVPAVRVVGFGRQASPLAHPQPRNLGTRKDLRSLC